MARVPTPLPQHCPSARELDDLELLLTGALAPRRTFDNFRAGVGQAAGRVVGAGLVTLDLPADLQGQPVELVDPEGLPLARLDADGTLTPLTDAQYGPFRRLHLTPAQARTQYAGRTWVPVTDALTKAQINELALLGPVVLVALTGAGTPALSPVALIRSSLAAAAYLLAADVVAVPLAAHGDSPQAAAADHDLGVQVLATYAQADRVHALREARPTDELPDDIAAIVDRDQPGPERRGLVLFFTGLSGSGKSTLARALMDRILERGERSVTSLDGDVVRRHLSAGLTFSKEDRETNIRRIGWVAAEIARHGGVAVCSPIAPFDETRQQVRAMVEEAGGDFFLVHVATPLAECEQRDRKGLYAKARRGEIPEFTGISSPYEEPQDAAVRVDTTGRSIEAALGDVLAGLASAGYGDLAGQASGAPAAAATPAPATSAPPAAQTTSAPTATDGPLRVLFVCTANICRSPYMEVTARSLLEQTGRGDAVEFTSAGTRGFHDHAMDEEMVRVLASGVDSATFRSRAATRDIVERADLVLTAESKHREALVEVAPRAFRRIFTLGQFVESIESDAVRGLAGRALVEAAGQHRAPSRPEHDVSDPYRRGPKAARTAADHITGLLERIVPRLADGAR